MTRLHLHLLFFQSLPLNVTFQSSVDLEDVITTSRAKAVRQKLLQVMEDQLILQLIRSYINRLGVQLAFHTRAIFDGRVFDALDTLEE